MDQTSNLYNPGFVGSQFHWWLGQVADSSSWRDNINDTTFQSAEDIPGWGYRYKVRIMGLHDEGDIIPDDQLPWAQTMYSVWGGGQGGSFQTPGIKEGMFVFGFFLDGVDEQVPIIMGVLGNNAKTSIKGLGQNLTEYAPKSAYKDDGSTKTSSYQNRKSGNNSLPFKESIDALHLAGVDLSEQDFIMDLEKYIPCPKSNDALEESSSIISNFQKAYEQLTNKLNSFGNAAMADKINESISNLIANTASLVAFPAASILTKVQDFILDDLNNKTRILEKTANITDRLKILESNIAAQGKLGCIFSKIKGNLANLIGAALRRSLNRRKNQAIPFPEGQVIPRTPDSPDSDLLPPPAPDGYYYPNPPCETEEILADVMSNVINEIMVGYDEAINQIAAGSGQKGVNVFSNSLTQENVITAFENGQLYAGIGAALAASLGIDANKAGAITSAFNSGNYAAALTSLVDLSGRNQALGALSASLQSLDNGDIVGAFSDLSGALGVDSKLMAAVGATFSAITSGNMLDLTNAVGNLSGLAPQVLTNVLGGRLPISGIDIGGFGALGGLNFDMALASTFISTFAAFLECDKTEKCSQQKSIKLSGELFKKDGNMTSFAQNIDAKLSNVDFTPLKNPPSFFKSPTIT